MIILYINKNPGKYQNFQKSKDFKITNARFSKNQYRLASLVYADNLKKFRISFLGKIRQRFYFKILEIFLHKKSLKVIDIFK